MPFCAVPPRPRAASPLAATRCPQAVSPLAAARCPRANPPCLRRPVARVPTRRACRDLLPACQLAVLAATRCPRANSWCFVAICCPRGDSWCLPRPVALRVVLSCTALAACRSVWRCGRAPCGRVARGLLPSCRCAVCCSGRVRFCGVLLRLRAVWFVARVLFGCAFLWPRAFLSCAVLPTSHVVVLAAVRCLRAVRLCAALVACVSVVRCSARKPCGRARCGLLPACRSVVRCSGRVPFRRALRWLRAISSCLPQPVACVRVVVRSSGRVPFGRALLWPRAV
jgi:hypothetical protein